MFNIRYYILIASFCQFHELVFYVFTLVVNQLVVAHNYGYVVHEYRSCKVAECFRFVFVKALEPTLQNAVQAVALHLFFQVLAVFVEVFVAKHAVMHAKQHLA